MLSGHSDVVPVEGQDWSSDPFTLTERDKKLYGRGTCDMKGFIAASLAMAPRFAASTLQRPLHFALTYDEEVGCLGGQALVAELAKAGIKPTVAIVGEPTSMGVIEGHKVAMSTRRRSPAWTATAPSRTKASTLSSTSYAMSCVSWNSARN